MKVKRVLGSEKVYEFEDGEKVLFEDRKRYKEKIGGAKTVSIDEAANVLEKKPRRWGRKKKGVKK